MHKPSPAAPEANALITALLGPEKKRIIFVLLTMFHVKKVWMFLTTPK